MTKTIKLKLFLFVSLLTFDGISYAGPTAFSCSVNIQNVLVYGDGSVNVLHSGRKDYTYICNLKTERTQDTHRNLTMLNF